MKDIKQLKEDFTVEQIVDIVAYLGGEPIEYDDKLVCKTICHGGEQHKLYYYYNTHLFHCYTECSESFDIFQLVLKIKSQEGYNWELPQAAYFVCNYFGIDYGETALSDKQNILKDWDVFKRYEHKREAFLKDSTLKEYDSHLLDYYPQLMIHDWGQEGITFDAIKEHGIKYNPVNHSILIPHYDINNRLIGVRERTLIKEQEKYGKYLPASLQGKMYNHPLSFNLYNINIAKDNIETMKKAIVFESEKSCIKYTSLFGKENNISVAVCGSNLIAYQVKMLLTLGVKEIIVSFDRQFKEIDDKEFQGWTKKLTAIHNKYSSFVNISFMFDKYGLLDYKDSPIDKTKEVFLELYQKRIYL